ncbi:MAG: hypothetical protein AAB558_01905 [Patescibacteria group bacterium]
MLVYTRTKIILSSLLVLSVLANGWLIYTYWIDVRAADRPKYASLFPGIEVDSVSGPNTEQLLRFSYVFVDNTDGGGYELVVADRKNCGSVSGLELALSQPFDPALYVEKPIWVEQFTQTEQGLVLQQVREDTFATTHLDELKKACSFFTDKVFD